MFYLFAYLIRFPFSHFLRTLLMCKRNITNSTHYICWPIFEMLGILWIFGAYHLSGSNESTHELTKACTIRDRECFFDSNANSADSARILRIFQTGFHLFLFQRILTTIFICQIRVLFSQQMICCHLYDIFGILCGATRTRFSVLNLPINIQRR